MVELHIQCVSHHVIPAEFEQGKFTEKDISSRQRIPFRILSSTLGATLSHWSPRNTCIKHACITEDINKNGGAIRYPFLDTLNSVMRGFFEIIIFFILLCVCVGMYVLDIYICVYIHVHIEIGQ